MVKNGTHNAGQSAAESGNTCYGGIDDVQPVDVVNVTGISCVLFGRFK
jgi:hypothetical protein